MRPILSVFLAAALVLTCCAPPDENPPVDEDISYFIVLFQTQGGIVAAEVDGVEVGWAKAGMDVDLIATADDDWKFKTWSVTGVSLDGSDDVSSARFEMPAAAVVIEAIFIKDAYSVSTATLPENLTVITPSPTGEQPWGTEITLAAPSEDPLGYEFVNWTLNGLDLFDGLLTEKSIVVLTPSNGLGNATANYQRTKHIVTVSSSPSNIGVVQSMVTILPSRHAVDWGTAMTVTIPVGSALQYRYKFTGWNEPLFGNLVLTGGTTVSDSTIEFKMPIGNVPLTANYVPIWYLSTATEPTTVGATITAFSTATAVDGLPATDTPDTVAGSIEVGKIVTIAAPATDPEGWVFVEWKLRGLVLAGDSALTDKTIDVPMGLYNVGKATAVYETSASPAADR